MLAWTVDRSMSLNLIKLELYGSVNSKRDHPSGICLFCRSPRWGICHQRSARGWDICQLFSTRGNFTFLPSKQNICYFLWFHVDNTCVFFIKREIPSVQKVMYYYFTPYPLAYCFRTLRFPTAFTHSYVVDRHRRHNEQFRGL